MAFDFHENHNFVETFFHKFGNIVIIQKNMIIIPEISFQTIGSTHIKIVEAFKSKENITTENISDAIIIYGLYLSSESELLAQSITGSNGKTHGVRIVKTQAKNDTISKVINFLLKKIR